MPSRRELVVETIKKGFDENVEKVEVAQVEVTLIHVKGHEKPIMVTESGLVDLPEEMEDLAYVIDLDVRSALAMQRDQ